MPKQEKEEEEMELIQIGEPAAPKTVTVLEMFTQLAAKEAEMIRAGRERVLEVQKTQRKRSN